MTKIEKIIITVVVVVGIIFLIRKLDIAKNEDGSIYIGWWPGVDISFSVYDDHVKAEYCPNRESTEVVIPDEIFGKPVTEIDSLFLNMFTIVEKVIIGKNVEIIENEAFTSYIPEFENQYLKYIEGGENVKYIGEYAFSNCVNLEHIELGENVEIIGNRAFRWCSNLSTISLSDKVKYIGKFAFCGSGIEEIYLSDTISDIGVSAFDETPWLAKQEEKENEFVIVGDGILLRYSGQDDKIAIPHGVRVVTDFIDGDEGIKEIYIPESVTEILAGSFARAEQPLRVYVPDHVIMIADWTLEQGEDALEQMNSVYFYEHVTFVTTENSTAHIYAKHKDIKYEIVAEMPEY